MITFKMNLLNGGLPSISSELEWLPQLFVSGGLADLELGPFARNIMGGREAAQRIKQAYKRLSAQPSKTCLISLEVIVNVTTINYF